ncbi:MAG: hypothetical protein HQL30_06730 [Candidatus Omnitrophica bacterium]|nr:hypothetical protein [Candidatus Omnitrophota bacterium]
MLFRRLLPTIIAAVYILDGFSGGPGLAQTANNATLAVWSGIDDPGRDLDLRYSMLRKHVSYANPLGLYHEFMVKNGVKVFIVPGKDTPEYITVPDLDLDPLGLVSEVTYADFVTLLIGMEEKNGTNYVRLSKRILIPWMLRAYKDLLIARGAYNNSGAASTLLADLTEDEKIRSGLAGNIKFPGEDMAPQDKFFGLKAGGEAEKLLVRKIAATAFTLKYLVDRKYVSARNLRPAEQRFLSVTYMITRPHSSKSSNSYFGRSFFEDIARRKTVDAIQRRLIKHSPRLVEAGKSERLLEKDFSRLSHQALLKLVRSSHVIIRKKAIKVLGERSAPAFTRIGEDAYYAVRYFFNTFVGIKYTDHSIDDFRDEAILEGYRTLDAMITDPKDPNPKSFGQYYNGKIWSGLIEKLIASKWASFPHHLADDGSRDISGRLWGTILASILRLTREPGDYYEGPIALKLSESDKIPEEAIRETLLKTTPEILAVVNIILDRSAGSLEDAFANDPDLASLSGHNIQASLERDKLLEKTSARISSLLKTLTYQQRVTIRHSYGLDAFEVLPQDTIGKKFAKDVSATRVSQIKLKAEAALRKPHNEAALAELFADLQELDSAPIPSNVVTSRATSLELTRLCRELTAAEARVLFLRYGPIETGSYMSFMTSGEISSLLMIPEDDVLKLERTALIKAVEFFKAIPNGAPELKQRIRRTAGFPDKDSLAEELSPATTGRSTSDLLPEPYRPGRSHPRPERVIDLKLDSWLAIRLKDPMQRAILSDVLNGKDVAGITGSYYESSAPGPDADKPVRVLWEERLKTVSTARKKLLSKLRMWFTLGVFSSLAPDNVIKDRLRAVAAEGELGRIMRRVGLIDFIKMTACDKGTLGEMLIYFFGDRFTKKAINDILTVSYREIADQAKITSPVISSDEFSGSLSKMLAGIVEELGLSSALRKEKALKRFWRGLFYGALLKAGTSSANTALSPLSRESVSAGRNSLTKKILDEILKEFELWHGFVPRGYNGKVAPLMPYQRYSVAQAVNTLEDPKERCAWFASDARTGKTITAALSALNVRSEDGAYDVSRLLVTVPNQAKYEWANELADRLDPALGYQIYVIDSSLGNIAEQASRAANLAASGQKVILIANYEAIVAAEDGIKRFAPDAHIIDEVENLRKGDKTVRAPVIVGIPSKYRIGVSARPVVKRPTDVIEPLLWMRKDYDPREHPTAGPSPSRETVPPDNVRREYLERMDNDRLFLAIEPVMVRWTRKQVLPELTDVISETRFVSMSRAQERTIAMQRSDFPAWKASEAREDKAEIAAHIFRRFDLERRANVDLRLILPEGKLPKKADGSPDEEEICPKVLELDKIIEDRLADNGKVVVLVDFVEEIEILVERYNRKYLDRSGSSAAIGLNQAVSLGDRLSGIDAFRKDMSPKILIGTTWLLGQSLNLFQAPGADFHISTMVRLSRPWMNFDDADRLIGIGQTRDVELITLVSSSERLKVIPKDIFARTGLDPSQVYGVMREKGWLYPLREDGILFEDLGTIAGELKGILSALPGGSAAAVDHLLSEIARSRFTSLDELLEKQLTEEKGYAIHVVNGKPVLDTDSMEALEQLAEEAVKKVAPAISDAQPALSGEAPSEKTAGVNPPMERERTGRSRLTQFDIPGTRRPHAGTRSLRPVTEQPPDTTPGVPGPGIVTPSGTHEAALFRATVDARETDAFGKAADAFAEAARKTELESSIIEQKQDFSEDLERKHPVKLRLCLPVSVFKTMPDIPLALGAVKKYFARSRVPISLQIFVVGQEDDLLPLTALDKDRLRLALGLDGIKIDLSITDGRIAEVMAFMSRQGITLDPGNKLHRAVVMREMACAGMDPQMNEYLLVVTDTLEAGAAEDLRDGLRNEANDKISFSVPVEKTPGRDMWTLCGIMKIWLNNIRTGSKSQLALPAMALLSEDLPGLISAAWRLLISA